MKKYIFLLSTLFTLFSCNDSFMERYPLDQETAKTFFTTYDNCKTYAWQFYGWYPGYTLDQTIMDTQSDNGLYSPANNENVFGWDKVVEPTGTSSGGWTYSRIRTIHVLLDNIDRVNMPESDKAHWKSVCYFFKAQEYFRLMSLFGDVIWVDKALSDSDTDILYGPATPRLEIARKILEMLQFAQKNIKKGGDGPNTVNLSVVNALISRFGLFEGTWQKYHQLSGKADYDKYLKASYDASADLIKEYPELHSNYNEIFNSKDLTGMKGVLLFKAYVLTKGHSIVRTMGSSGSYYEACADLVQSYLCSDGKPIWTSDKYEGDKTTGDAPMNIEFRNRDYRLYYSICPPYRVNTPFPQNKDMSAITYTDNPDDKEWIDFMEKLSTPNAVKTLPIMQWNSEVVREMPHFQNARYNMGQGYNISTGGYFPYKIYIPDNQSAYAENDAPIYRMGEVMVNHAEAAWELGLFDQGVADVSINILRKRAHIADMKVGEIHASFDPKRDKGGWSASSADGVAGPPDYEVDPVLWEIRRERRVELYCEGFRFNDLRRWAKGKYISKRQFGAYIKKSDYEDERHITYMNRTPGIDGVKNFTMKLLDPSKDEGRIVIFGTPNPGWLNKYYLYPVPLDDLSLNENLKQNPGYRSSTGK